MFQMLALSLVLAQPPAKASAKYAVPWYVPAPARDMDAVKMYFAIKGGSMMGPGEGWFGPAQQRYTWGWLAAQHKIETDEAIAKDKFRGPPELFARLDRDGDGSLKKDDFDWSNGSEYVRQLGEARWWASRNDADADYRLTKAEWDKVFEKAAEGKGYLSPEDVRAVLFPPVPPRSGGFNPGDKPSKEKLIKGLFAGEIGSPFPGPNVGMPAPDFTLPTADGSRTVTLSKLIGPKPVVLMFGNFTCGPFRSWVGSVEALKAKYGDRVEFLGVYVREAHPTEGWRMASNDKVGVTINQPKSTAERVGVAKQCQSVAQITMPLLVDDINDHVGHLYSGMPARLYLIDRQGKIAYKGGRGPFGLKPGELEQAINLLFLDESLQRSKPAADGEPPLAMLSDEQAWAALPAATSPKAGPLPGWAKALAGPLPRTTAAMLELDHIVRAAPPVDAKLAAKVRWAAANANGCRAGEAIAVGDLLRAGGSAGDVTALVDDWDRLPAAEQTTLRFARKLSRMASTVTDAEFAEVRAIHGDAGAVGLTLLLAYANFQDRLLLSLGLPADVLPPVNVRFTRPYQGGMAVSRALPADPPPGPPVRFTDPNWLKVGADSLRAAMAGQKARAPRVPAPEVSDKSPSKIRWSRTVVGYQPDIGKAWLNCLRTFGEENKQDRVFEESLFWVVTRTIDCFY